MVIPSANVAGVASASLSLLSDLRIGSGSGSELGSGLGLESGLGEG